MKPLYKILIILAIIVVLAVTVYWLWGQISTPKKIISPPSIQTPGSIQPTEANKPAPQKISDRPIFNYWLSPETEEIFYLTPKGEVYNAKAGEDILYSSQTFSAINSIIPSPSAQEILMAFGDPRQPQWGIFDINDRTWRPLPADLLEATWADSDHNLIGLVKNQQNISLANIDLQSSPPKIKIIISDFRFKDIDLKWQAPDQLLIMEKPSASYRGKVWKLDLKTLSFQTLYGPELGLMLYHSQDNQYLFKYSLPYRFFAINNQKQFSLPPTFPQKCDSYLNTIYCFVPSSLTLPDSTLPDDYFSRKTYSLDALFVNDLESGDMNQIFMSSQENIPAIDATNVRITPDGFLYFINRYDNYLYEFPLGGY